jgi:glutaredoxin-like protein NrdH
VEIKHVKGRDKGEIMVYALSTCVWCRKAKNLLNSMGVAYSFLDVDLVDAAEMARVKAEVRRWNPQGSYPTIVIDGERCISGFDETEIREALGDA